MTLELRPASAARSDLPALRTLADPAEVRAARLRGADILARCTLIDGADWTALCGTFEVRARITTGNNLRLYLRPRRAGRGGQLELEIERNAIRMMSSGRVLKALNTQRGNWTHSTSSFILPHVQPVKGLCRVAEEVMDRFELAEPEPEAGVILSGDPARWSELQARQEQETERLNFMGPLGGLIGAGTLGGAALMLNQISGLFWMPVIIAVLALGLACFSGWVLIGMSLKSAAQEKRRSELQLEQARREDELMVLELQAAGREDLLTRERALQESRESIIQAVSESVSSAADIRWQVMSEAARDSVARLEDLISRARDHEDPELQAAAAQAEAARNRLIERLQAPQNNLLMELDEATRLARSREEAL